MACICIALYVVSIYPKALYTTLSNSPNHTLMMVSHVVPGGEAAGHWALWPPLVGSGWSVLPKGTTNETARARARIGNPPITKQNPEFLSHSCPRWPYSWTIYFLISYMWIYLILYERTYTTTVGRESIQTPSSLLLFVSLQPFAKMKK